MRNPALAYRQFSVQGATPLGLVVMLYDGVIAALQKAIAALEARDISGKCAQLNRAVAIIAQLEGTLNFEKGGEVAQTLKSLYIYARAQVLKGNLENSPEILRSLIQKLTPVREAWSEADRMRPQPAPEAASETPAEQVRPAPPAGRRPYPSAEESAYGSSPDGDSGSWRVSA